MADNDAGAGAIGGGGDQVNSLLRNEDDDSETVEEMFRYVDKLKKVVEEVGDSLLEKADLKAKKLHLATRFTEEMLTTNEIKHFFEEKANIMIVRVEKKWDAWDEELKAKVFEALVVFPTHQDLKKALDLEGREYNGRVYYLSEVVGRFVVYAVGDLENISTDKDIVAQELTRKFKKCAVEKILLPLNKETGEILGFGYLVVRRDELAANPEALNLKDLDVRHCPEIRKGLLKALMMKNGSSVHFSGNNIGPTEPYPFNFLDSLFLRLTADDEGAGAIGGELELPPVHVVTPRPSNAKSSETPVLFGCKVCSRVFNSEKGLQSHTEAKHSAPARIVKKQMNAKKRRRGSLHIQNPL
ncbi:unnamed protein product [Arabis nemorensis]|uniref:C2H2-type domain-containing protein n=1 Tax=Arabis nemorensis TaxID=586526 RepID=A0A565B450_9BRAS|nr:unnamed protein product [Arabis nemorensis]